MPEPRFTEHDYDPSWDYDVLHRQYDHPVVQEAQRHMDRLSSLSSTQFSQGHIIPANLAHEGVVAKYVGGTYNEPVVMFDLDAHEDAHPDEVRRTVEHEVRHAIQEHADPDGDWADEHHAEHGEEFH